MQNVAYRERPVCLESAGGCGFVDFGHYSLGVGGLVVDVDTAGEKRALLIQRNEEPNKGGWTIPGGFVEYDETVEVAVVREVEEETGLQCESLGLAGYRNRADPNDNSSYVVFLLKWVSGQLKTDPNDEIAQAGFYTLTEMEKMKRLAPLSFELAKAAISDNLQPFQPMTVQSLFGRPPFTLYI